MTAACLSIFWITQKRRCHCRRTHILIFDKRRMNGQSARWWDPRTWLAFVFWELRTIFNAYSNDGLSDLKAAAVIGMVEILAFGAITSAWSVYHGRRVVDHSTIYIVALIVALLNAGTAFGGNKPWQRLYKEFEGYSAFIRIGGG